MIFSKGCILWSTCITLLVGPIEKRLYGNLMTFRTPILWKACMFIWKPIQNLENSDDASLLYVGLRKYIPSRAFNVFVLLWQVRSSADLNERMILRGCRFVLRKWGCRRIPSPGISTSGVANIFMLLCLPVCFSKCGFMYSDRFTAGPFHVVVGQRRLILEDILSVNQSYCRQSCWGFVVPGWWRPWGGRRGL